MELREDGLANAVGRACIFYGFQENIGLAGAGKPRCALTAMLDVGKQFLPLAGCYLVINIPRY